MKNKIIAMLTVIAVVTGVWAFSIAFAGDTKIKPSAKDFYGQYFIFEESLAFVNDSTKGKKSLGFNGLIGLVLNDRGKAYYQKLYNTEDLHSIIYETRVRQVDDKDLYREYTAIWLVFNEKDKKTEKREVNEDPINISNLMGWLKITNDCLDILKAQKGIK